MSAASEADVLGLRPGMLVQELGWDEDTDATLRDAIMDAIDADMVEEAIEAVDVVFRRSSRRRNLVPFR